MEPSRRSADIQPFLVMEVLDRAQELEHRGTDVIHLEIGEPDFPTPRCIIDAAQRAAEDGHTGYTHSLGLRELREAIAEEHSRRAGAEVHPDQVLVSSGSSPAMLLLFAAILDPGGEVILSRPYYPCYPNFIRMVGGEPVFVPVDERDGFQLDPDRVKAAVTPRTRAVIINSPANPTGAVLSRDRVDALGRLGVPIVSDEIYHGLVYEGRAHSALEFTDQTFVIDGFSKRYAMTGWRLGYAIAPPDLIRPIQRMAQSVLISANNFIQRAGVVAICDAGPDVARMVEAFGRRRSKIISRLRAIGFGVAADPAGAFYVFANAKAFTEDSYRFAFELLENAHVAVTPGIDFGAEGFIRFSYANSVERIEEGMDRIARYLAARGSAR